MKSTQASIRKIYLGKKVIGYPLLLILGIICSCSDNAQKDKHSVSDMRSTSTNSPDTQVSVIQNKPDDPISSWSYQESEDKMTSKKILFASVNANDELQFEFPYDGGSIATFTIRKKNGSTDIYLHVSKGQFNNTFEGGQVKMRFDSNPAKRYSFSGASDGSSDIIFINSAKEIINKLKNSSKMLIEVEFYNEGNRQIEFDVGQLKWD